VHPPFRRLVQVLGNEVTLAAKAIDAPLTYPPEKLLENIESGMNISVYLCIILLVTYFNF
jgi:hypothetical protein